MPGLQTVAWKDQLEGLGDWATFIDKGVMACNGVSVVLYNQSKDPRTKQGGELVSGGFCLAMSIMWIIKTARGESFWDWFQPPGVACPNLKNKNQQARWNPILPLMKEIMRQEGQRIALTKQFTAKGGQIDPDLFMKTNAWFAPKISHDSAAQRHLAGESLDHHVLTGDAVADMITKTKSGYRVLNVMGTKGAHAMAARVVDGTVVFMDPNYGEFYFPSFADFKKFMRNFWRMRFANKLSDVVFVNSFTDPEVIKYG